MKEKQEEREVKWRKKRQKAKTEGQERKEAGLYKSGL